MRSLIYQHDSLIHLTKFLQSKVIQQRRMLDEATARLKSTQDLSSQLHSLQQENTWLRQQLNGNHQQQEHLSFQSPQGQRPQSKNMRITSRHGRISRPSTTTPVSSIQLQSPISEVTYQPSPRPQSRCFNNLTTSASINPDDIRLQSYRGGRTQPTQSNNLNGNNSNRFLTRRPFSSYSHRG